MCSCVVFTMSQQVKAIYSAYIIKMASDDIQKKNIRKNRGNFSEKIIDGRK